MTFNIRLCNLFKIYSRLTGIPCLERRRHLGRLSSLVFCLLTSRAVRDILELIDESQTSLTIIVSGIINMRDSANPWAFLEKVAKFKRLPFTASR